MKSFELNTRGYLRYFCLVVSACFFAYCFISSYTLAFMYRDIQGALWYMVFGIICFILYLCLCFMQKKTVKP